ncbi:hypothetical protein GJ697_28860 [Pseudoduganella sp. FT25W]|uniref:Integral membrane bound transporter domain-containing protein n=1 Tax=Duganella alba TaxID=2666081 RepID=A0A6L5QQ76_9BURK|nr:FUSC family protein [Duganella alba]MRX11847.1 hypothetical protein [Duganella alba]MRX20220.1 hypothetical protein [Duganella alba]
MKLAALRDRLAPFPGRAQASLRMLAACLLIVSLSMTLQIPNAALSAYMVFFISRREAAATRTAGIALIAAASVAIGLTLLAYRVTIDAAPLRLALMTLLFCAGMYLSRVFVAGPLGFGLGFILLVTQSTVDLYPGGEPLVRDTLWTWMAICFAIVVVLLIDMLLPARAPALAPQGAAAPPRARRLFVDDALRNPVYLRFALKTTFAAMLCYIVYTALAWPGIHTCLITCAVIALASNEATLHKATLRIAGALVGGGLALLATVFVVPHLESLGGLLLTIAPVVAVSAWIAAGPERDAYFGWQIAFAFFLCVLHGYGPSTDVTPVRDRLVGIVFGIIVMSVMFRFVWPERAAGDGPAPV